MPQNKNKWGIEWERSKKEAGTIAFRAGNEETKIQSTSLGVTNLEVRCGRLSSKKCSID